MTARGWELNALQKPNAIHIALTLQHVKEVDQFMKDLEESVKTIMSNPKVFTLPLSINSAERNFFKVVTWHFGLQGKTKGMAPIYGMASSMPDRGAIGDLMVAFMNGSTDV